MNSRWRTHYKSQLVIAQKEIERLNSVINRLVGDKDDLDDDLTDAEVKIDRLRDANENLSNQIRQLAPADPETVTLEQYNVLAASKCANCGGVHTAACPRVKRIRFQTGGQTPAEVEFWRDDEWPKENVKWIENLVIETPS